MTPVAQLQRRWMTSACAIGRPAPDGDFDADSGHYPTAEPDQIYAGPCLIVPTGGERVVDHGGGPVTLRTYNVTLDGPVEGIQVDDRVGVTSSRDPKLAGVTLTVLDVPGSDLVINRRLVCEERLR